MDLTVEKIDGKVGVAVSGGVDSMTLLYLYCQQSQDVVAVNIEHGIRGESSLTDTDFVKKFCLLNNIPFLSFSVKTLENIQVGESVETCARRLRYEVFDKLLSDKTVSKIALAHHADDNAETVLMHIFRGTGLRGLVGITEREGYIRPLLKYSRAEIEQYAEERTIPHITDETNGQNAYTRNFIRNELMPLIKLKYPSVLASVTRLSETALEADTYLTSLAVAPVKIDGGYVLNGVFRLPKIVQKYSVMQVIKLLGNLQDFETRHVESVCILGEKPNNTSIDLPFGLTATRYNDDLFVTETCAYGDFKETAFSEDVQVSFRGKTYRFETGTSIINGITFDMSKLPQGAVIRRRLDGDEFKRVNGKTKLLSDFLTDKKMPKYEKNSLLVLAKNNEIFAILGVETADSVKVTDTTTKILHIIRE